MSVKRYYLDKSNVAMCIGDELVEFKAYDGGGLFVTDNPLLQKAIEGHELYGNRIKGDKLNAEPETLPATKESTKTVNEDATVIDSVTSLQDAKELLRSEPYNIDFRKLNTPKAILDKAKELNIVFPNLAQ